jgi:hypothetical protein
MRSNGTTTLNGKLGYRVSNDTRIEVIGFNLLNSRHSAIDYAADSYTPPGSTTPLPTADGPYRVFHPIEPLNFRVMLITRY